MYRQVEESQTLLINTQSKALEAQNKRVIKLGFGQSPFLPPSAVMDALRGAAHRKDYSSVQGDYELRSLIAQFHAAHNGLSASAENILVAPGSKILIFSILYAFLKADVFVPTPAWVSYAPQVKLAGHHGIKLNTSFEQRWRLSPDIIRQAAKSKKYKTSILILNYPGNPDGLSYSEAELKALAELARELDMLVISDEIYGLLAFNKNHLSFANYYPEKTITTTGLSKWCGAGGWRLGVAMLYEDIEADFKQALIGIGSETYSCAPTPIQIAAKTAYGNFDQTMHYLDQQIDILKVISLHCSHTLNEAGIRVHAPEGGFYLFPDFSLHQQQLAHAGLHTAAALCQRLLQDTGVALLPASAFGFDDNYLAARLAFVDFEDPMNQASFDLNRDCPNVVEGIELICDWVKNLS